MSSSVWGQLFIQKTNTQYNISFDNTLAGVNEGSYLGDGFSPFPDSGQIDSDAFKVSGLSSGSLNFGGTKTSGSFARGLASKDVVQGGVYSFKVGEDNFTLGANPRGGNFRPGSFTLLVINKTGQIIDLTRIKYELWYYNSEERSTQQEFAWSFDGVTYTPDTNTFYMTPIVPSTVLNWEDTILHSAINANIPPGDSIYLKWKINDGPGSGPSADQVGLNNISVIMEESAFLPVQWISFEAQKDKTSAKLIWKTAEEINNDHFLIQHSSDGDHWENIGRKRAHDEEAMINTYSYSHHDVLEGNNYYRLKQLDQDGAFDISPVRRVFFSGKHLNRNFNVYPSPADEFIFIEYKDLREWNDFRIIDDQGRMIRQFGHSIPQKINVSSFADGVYWITAHSSQDTLREKFIIQ